MSRIGEAEEKDGEDRARNRQKQKWQSEADIGHIDSPADEHRRNIDGRCGHAHDGANGDDGASLLFGNSHQEEDRGHQRPRGKDRRGRAPGNHSGKHDHQHQQYQHQGRHPGEVGDDGGVQRLEGTRLLGYRHEKHGGGDDQHGIHIREGPLVQVAEGHSLAASQSPGHRADDHGKAHRQPQGEIGKQERGKHHQQADQFDIHALFPQRWFISATS